MADAVKMTIWTTAAPPSAARLVARAIESNGFSVGFHESSEPPPAGAAVILRWAEGPDGSFTGDWRDEARMCLNSGEVRAVIVAAPGASGVEHLAGDSDRGGASLRSRSSKPLRSQAPEQRETGGPPSAAVLMIGVDPARGAEVIATIAEIALSCVGKIADTLMASDDLFKTQEEFVAIASHDLRTPVSTLRLLHDLLSSKLKAGAGGLSPKELSDFDELLEIMARNLDKMEAFTEDILSAWRLFRGRAEADTGPVSLNAVVEDAVAGLFPSAMRKDIALDLVIDSSIERVSAESRRAGQVVANLVGNAVKYTPRGGTVTVYTRAGEGGAVLEVADTGPGIPEDERAGLFERFSRGSARATGGEPSTGLGLYICREIVEHHGGRIWFEPRGEVGQDQGAAQERGGVGQDQGAAQERGEEEQGGSRFLVFWPYGASGGRSRKGS